VVQKINPFFSKTHTFYSSFSTKYSVNAKQKLQVTIKRQTDAIFIKKVRKKDIDK